MEEHDIMRRQVEKVMRGKRLGARKRDKQPIGRNNVNEKCRQTEIWRMQQEQMKDG